MDPPDGFGIDRTARMVMPSDGDNVSAKVAALQHEFVCAWRNQPGRSSGAALARGFGCSRQTWSQMVLGRRWMGETLLVALIAGLRDRPGTGRRRR